jgi:hypothetical protein
MKKTILYLLLIMGLGVFVSCEKEKTSWDDSTITYYVNFDMAGDQVMIVPVGTGFTDPGVTAYEAGEDVTSKMEVTGSVDPDALGEYFITYSATNVDGFSSSVTRTVYIYDPAITLDISGTYTSQPGSWYVGTTRSTANATIQIVQLCPGIFSIDDVTTYFWVNYYGYSSMKTKGIISLKSDNSLELLSSLNGYWNDSCESFSGTYDPATETIEYDYKYVYPGHTILTLN